MADRKPTSPNSFAKGFKRSMVCSDILKKGFMSQFKNDRKSDEDRSKLEDLEELGNADFSPFMASFRKCMKDLSETEKRIYMDRRTLEMQQHNVMTTLV